MKYNVSIEWDDDGYYVGRLRSEPSLYLYSCDSKTVSGVLGGLSDLMDGEQTPEDAA
jgi:predicted RNase H-like HicB family nuclease